MKRSHELATYQMVAADHHSLGHGGGGGGILLATPSSATTCENVWMDEVQDIQRTKRNKMHMDLQERLASNTTTSSSSSHYYLPLQTHTTNTPFNGSRKRPLHDRESPMRTYSKEEVEKAREEGREETRQSLAPVIIALKEDRERLLRDQQVLKSGVITLNAKRQELSSHLEHTQRQLDMQVARYRELENALHMRGIQLGGCRLDSSRDPGFGGPGGPDVF